LFKRQIILYNIKVLFAMEPFPFSLPAELLRKMLESSVMAVLARLWIFFNQGPDTV